MDRRGGCCIAMYQNGSVCDMSKVDRIMLKFRPIAPKPVVGSPTQSNEQTSSKNSSKSGRGKRKYYKENNNKKQKKNNSSNKKKKANSDETELSRKTSSDSVVTLSLLPETPERKESFVTVKEENKSQSPVWLMSFAPSDGGHVEQRTVLMAPKPVTSIVTVECVTDTWLDGNVLGRNDHERMVRLGEDTCPCFVSDGLDRVWWTNRAYGEMVGSEEVIVQLVKMVSVTCDAFSCKARVRCGEGKGATIMTFPCDVWRMDGGGYAWRLDVESALSLGFRV